MSFVLLETGDRLLLEDSGGFLLEAPTTGRNLLLENGDALLLESGDNLLLEAAEPPPPVTAALLLENGFYLLLESGDHLLLEGGAGPAPPQPQPGGNFVHLIYNRRERKIELADEDEEVIAILALIAAHRN